LSLVAEFWLIALIVIIAIVLIDIYRSSRSSREDLPKNDYHRIYSFLSKDEKVLRDLDDRWRAVYHDGIISKKTNTFYWGEVRMPLLTDRRLTIIKDGTVESEVFIIDMKKADDRYTGGVFSSFPYLRIELKNGKYVSLAFVFAARAIIKKFPAEKKGEYYQYSGWRGISSFVVTEWKRLISRLLEENGEITKGIKE
jgi:hypothetical protein